VRAVEPKSGPAETRAGVPPTRSEGLPATGRGGPAVPIPGHSAAISGAATRAKTGTCRTDTRAMCAHASTGSASQIRFRETRMPASMSRLEAESQTGAGSQNGTSGLKLVHGFPNPVRRR